MKISRAEGVLELTMSLTDYVSPTRSSFPGLEDYDHEISMLDATSPVQPPSPAPPVSATDFSRQSGEHGSIKLWQKGGLRDEIARRKYARFQEDRYTDDVEDNPRESKDGERVSRSETVMKSLDARRGRLLERLHLRVKKASKAKEQETATDILYENQRGLFLFGYPLYSSRSLLNLDPSPWTNGAFEDSAVDIRNAQVPDPTWAWAWKRWYVDMSDDVDEEGWQYSLSFGKKFGWHGTHPWFHSAVRRRRWLRKRVRVGGGHREDAHSLNPDYFTIHSARREPSRGSSTERGAATGNRSSYYSGRFSAPDESESEVEDVTNVVSLIQGMKKTTVDRKKLDLLKNFLTNGGEELHFLPNAIPEILQLLLYQNSRRQVLSVLEQALYEEKDSSHAQSSDKAKTPASSSTSPAPISRTEDLRTAIQAVHDNIKNVEYYSDVKAIERQYHGGDSSGSSEDVGKGKDSDRLAQVRKSKEPVKDVNIEVSRVEIKGIPHEAGVDVEPGIFRPTSFMKDGAGDEEGG